MLYRKYRPQSFKEVVGQNYIKITLENELKSGRTAHAYLFCGPRAVGKTTMARLLAKSVNCEKRKEGESEPCNKCPSCLAIMAGNSLDMIEIDAASHTGVENVRENIIANAQVGAGSGKYKVFIIDEVHMLSTSAFNALLKTLEEPPKKTIFILATTEIHKLPATILSRCQRFDFRRIDLSDIVERLGWISGQEGYKIEKEVLDRIAYLSEGYQRDAESLLSQVLSVADNKGKIKKEDAELVLPRSNLRRVFEFIRLMIAKDVSNSIELIGELSEQGIDLGQFTQECLELLRKMILAKASALDSQGGKLGDFSVELDSKGQQEMIDLLAGVEIGELVRMVEILLEKRYTFKDVSIVQLPLELSVIEFSGLKTCKVLEIEKKASDIPKKKIAKKKEEKELESSPEPVFEQDPESEDTDDFQKPVIDKKSIDYIKIDKPSAQKQEDVMGPGDGRTIVLDEIVSNWAQLMKLISERNHSLTYVLGVSRPLEITGQNVLKLGVKYKYLKDRIENVQNKLALEKCLLELLGTRVYVEASVSDVEIENPIESESFVDDVLQTFGGKVVE